jgi:predicted esterase
LTIDILWSQKAKVLQVTTSIGQNQENPAQAVTIWDNRVSLGEEPRIAVLAVHGRGQNPSFMQEQSHRLNVAGVRYYAPRAPEDSWYPLGFMVPFEDNEPKLSESLRILQTTLQQIREDGFSPHQIVLWGFSQGACLITQYVIQSQEIVGGLLLFTGGYLGPERLETPDSASFDGVPIVLRSIDEDPWVPQSRVIETAEYFVSAGAQVNVQIDKGSEHGITDEAMSAGTELLSAL